MQLADDGERGNEPERANEEGSFLAGESVIGLVGAAAQHEFVLRQVARDRVDGRAETIVFWRKEAEDGGEQH